MKHLSFKAYAKVNLTLEVLSLRDDGYHNLRSVFQQISLHDRISITPTNSEGLSLNDCINIPPNENILTATYNALCDILGKTPGVEVHLQKHIPMQAGLGGASADCAALLRGLNTLWDMRLSQEELLAIGAKLGADVPACLCGGSLLAGGIGDVITPIESKLHFAMVIIKPPVACSTPIMYRKLDERSARQPNPQATHNVVQALKSGDFGTLCANLHNDFESVVEDSEVLLAHKALWGCGAQAVLLAGSGSSVFGVFARPKDAISAYHILCKTHNCYLCRTL